jgi:hypothetical protein
MEELRQLFTEELQSVDPVSLITVIAGVVVFVAELILYSKGLIFSAGKKRLENAKKNGYTVTAHRTFVNFEDRENDSGHTERIWEAVYEYDFKGVHGKKMVFSHQSIPPTTITLYHDGKSYKVYTEAEMSRYKRSFLMLIIPLVVMLLVAKLLGYQP